VQPTSSRLAHPGSTGIAWHGTQQVDNLLQQGVPAANMLRHSLRVNNENELARNQGSFGIGDKQAAAPRQAG